MKKFTCIEKNGKKYCYFNTYRAYEDCRDLAGVLKKIWNARVKIELDVGYRVDYLVEIDSFLLKLSYDDYEGNFLVFDDFSSLVAKNIIDTFDQRLNDFSEKS